VVAVAHDDFTRTTKRTRLNRFIHSQFPHWAKGLAAQIAIFAAFLGLLAMTAAVFGLLAAR
jgi:hypothetical protein